MVKSEKITKQIAGTMAIEGMRLNNKELTLIRECASGHPEAPVEASIKSPTL